MRDGSISSALILEILQSCTEPSRWNFQLMSEPPNLRLTGDLRDVFRKYSAETQPYFNQPKLLPFRPKLPPTQTRQIWGIWKLRPAYSPETPNLGQNRWCFVPCDLEIWWMTLENNRASLLCCFKLCATFHSHWWIQTGFTVRKRPIWVKFDNFFSRLTLKFDGWP